MSIGDQTQLQWRKSSRSTNTGGDCVEVASLPWRKSSRSGDTGGDCVEVANLPWRKSSRSGDTGGACVEVAGLAAEVGVRDSKDPDGPKLRFASAEWRAFAQQAKSGEFDLG